MTFSVIVAGLGAMGSAVAFHLARRGVRVIGLDRFAPPHPFGSSHGESRIIREAYFEHPAYVPLVQRAYRLWQELEVLTGESLLRITGGVLLGAPESKIITGALRSAQSHGLAHEVLTASEVRKRFPALQPPETFIAVYEPRAGVLRPEACVAAHLRMAARYGTVLHFEEPVREWRAGEDGVEVITERGRYSADRMVWCLGAWLPAWLPAAPLWVERQVMFWFRPARDAENFAPGRCPIYIVEFAPERSFYGFPDLGAGVKVARHHGGEPCAPETVRRVVGEEEVEAMRGLLPRFLPGLSGPLMRTEVCLYTNTPDGHFLLDRHPEHPQVFVVSPCSGHGFKFSSAIGELVAEAVRNDAIQYERRLFGWRW